MRDIVNTATLSRELGVSQETLRRWCRKGQFPRPQMKLGNSGYWSRKVLAREMLGRAWNGKAANDKVHAEALIKLRNGV